MIQIKQIIKGNSIYLIKSNKISYKLIRDRGKTAYVSKQKPISFLPYSHYYIYKFSVFQLWCEVCESGRILNLLMNSVPRYIETSQSIYSVNQLTGFYIMGYIGR